MYAKGHAGLTLFLASILMLPFGSGTQQLIVIIFATGLSALPDIDLKWQRRGLPIHHRKQTHSILFSIIVGILLGILLQYAYGTFLWFLTGFIAGNLGIISHMLGDLLTHMEFKPLWPFKDTKLSFGITKASNRAANDGLMTLGSITFILYYLQTQGSLQSIIDSLLGIF